MAWRSLQGWVLAAVVLAGGPGMAEETRPGPARPEPVTIVLNDGSRLVGTVVDEDEAAVTLRLASGEDLRILRTSIARKESAPGANGKIAPPRSDPNDTRLMFAPSGRPLGKGDGYVSNHYVVFPGFAYGLTDHLSVGGGVSTVPALGLRDQLFYASAQAGWRLSDKAAVSVGGLYAGGVEDLSDAGVVYGTSAFGRPDRSLTVGVALVTRREEEERYDRRGRVVGSDVRWQTDPVIVVGGSVRVATQLSLVTESWIFPKRPISEQPIGLALRFFGDRLSVDAGFVIVPEVLDEGFPIPWLSFSYHFGPSRSAARRSASLLGGGLGGHVPRGR